MFALVCRGDVFHLRAASVGRAATPRTGRVRRASGQWQRAIALLQFLPAGRVQADEVRRPLL